MFSSHPDQLAPEAGEGAVDHLHRVSPGVDVAADCHVGIAAAQDAQVGDLDLGDDNRLALQHDELDNAVGGAHGEKVFGKDFNEDVGTDKGLFNQFLAVGPLAQGLLQRKECLNAVFFQPVADAFLCARMCIDCIPPLLRLDQCRNLFFHGRCLVFFHKILCIAGQMLVKIV